MSVIDMYTKNIEWKNTHFSSYTAPPPVTLLQSYVLPTPVTLITHTSSARGITAKHLLCMFFSTLSLLVLLLHSPSLTSTFFVCSFSPLFIPSSFIPHLTTSHLLIFFFSFSSFFSGTSIRFSCVTGQALGRRTTPSPSGRHRCRQRREPHSVLPSPLLPASLVYLFSSFSFFEVRGEVRGER